jgi:hypothetical protein
MQKSLSGESSSSSFSSSTCAQTSFENEDENRSAEDEDDLLERTQRWILGFNIWETQGAPLSRGSVYAQSGPGPVAGRFTSDKPVVVESASCTLGGMLCAEETPETKGHDLWYHAFGGVIHGQCDCRAGKRDRKGML